MLAIRVEAGGNHGREELELVLLLATHVKRFGHAPDQRIQLDKEVLRVSMGPLVL